MCVLLHFVDIVFHGKCLDLVRELLRDREYPSVQYGYSEQCSSLCIHTSKKTTRKELEHLLATDRYLFHFEYDPFAYEVSSNTFWCLGLCVTCKRIAQHVAVFFPPTFKRLWFSKRNWAHTIF